MREERRRIGWHNNKNWREKTKKRGKNEMLGIHRSSDHNELNSETPRKATPIASSESHTHLLVTHTCRWKNNFSFFFTTSFLHFVSRIFYLINFNFIIMIIFSVIF
jgi:hypothetical protein